MDLRSTPGKDSPIAGEDEETGVQIAPSKMNRDILATGELEQISANLPELLPYSAFGLSQKRWILALVAFAGWFSSLSSFIYFPAIPLIASDLDLTTERVNLTVTAYLIVSGIFPSFVGSAADKIGRRPVFIVTLAIYVAANFGLALQSSFGLLFSLRMIQSAGISGSYSVTYGVLGDLFTPSERGGYSGLVSFILNTPPSFGPVISGILMQRWGWRSIFWFLAVISPCCLFAIIIFLPETSRHVVRDGRVAPRRANRVLISCLMPSSISVESQFSRSEKRSCQYPKPWEFLQVLRFPGTAIVILSVGIYYTIYTCIQASLSTLFTEVYNISGMVSGLIYLPFGVGCAISAFATGKILDIEYRHTASIYNLNIDKTRNHHLPSFPIEEARLRIVKYSLAICCILIIGYGWSLQSAVHIAVPLVLQFFIGLTMQVVFTSTSTLLVDLHPECPSTTQATSNLVRCEMSAGMLAVLDTLLRKLGSGWCFVFFAGLALICIPLLYLLEIRGMSWRRKKISFMNNLGQKKGGRDTTSPKPLARFDN